MSMFEDPRYRWRETCFVLFRSRDRPKLKAVRKAIEELGEQYEIANLRADSQGRIDSLTVVSPDDFAAMDICYTTGEEVLEQGATLAEEVRATARSTGQAEPAVRIEQFDARFDVLHFEQVPEFPEDDDEEALDPSALLLVLSALAKLTGGVAVDPQAGAILSD
jgi:hypothetical protein